MKKILFIFIVLISFNSCSKEQENTHSNQWKKQIIIWGSTACPHCVNAMPQFKEKIYDTYKEKIDIQVNSINWEKFEVDIPQNLDTNTIPDFETLVWKKCDYIPSFVVFDENKKLILSSCWWEKNIDDILNVLK